MDGEVESRDEYYATDEEATEEFDKREIENHLANRFDFFSKSIPFDKLPLASAAQKLDTVCIRLFCVFYLTFICRNNGVQRN